MHGGSEQSGIPDSSALLLKNNQSHVANLIGDQSDLSEYHEIKPIDFKSV